MRGRRQGSNGNDRTLGIFILKQAIFCKIACSVLGDFFDRTKLTESKFLKIELNRSDQTELLRNINYFSIFVLNYYTILNNYKKN